jgi:hypothetical protein
MKRMKLEALLNLLYTKETTPRKKKRRPRILKTRSSKVNPEMKIQVKKIPRMSIRNQEAKAKVELVNLLEALKIRKRKKMISKFREILINTIKMKKTK